VYEIPVEGVVVVVVVGVVVELLVEGGIGR
jgi:hypothetical protein